MLEINESSVVALTKQMQEIVKARLLVKDGRPAIYECLNALAIVAGTLCAGCQGDEDKMLQWFAEAAHDAMIDAMVLRESVG